MRALIVTNGIWSDQDWFSTLLGATRGEPEWRGVAIYQYRHFSLLPWSTRMFRWITTRKARHLANLAERIREVERPRAISLLGHSYGALISLEAARLYPYRIQSLILLGAAVPVDAEIPENVRHVLNFYSREDNVIRLLSYAGRAGAEGLEGNGRVHNIELNCEHTEYHEGKNLVTVVHEVGRYL